MATETLTLTVHPACMFTAAHLDTLSVPELKAYRLMLLDAERGARSREHGREDEYHYAATRREVEIRLAEAERAARAGKGDS